MRLVLLGPPGVGKGTQAERLARDGRACHVSTGDLFRAAVARGTEVGRKAKQYLDAGALVPDEVVTAILRERVAESDCDRGFVLDGFPRTPAQAEALDLLLAERGEVLDAVLYFAASEEVLVERLSGRRMCRGCGANFHLRFRPPRRPGACDQCGGELYQRSDDAPETIRKRLRVYLESTEPLIEHYRRGGTLLEVNAEADPDEVAQRTRALLAERAKGRR